MVDVDVKSLSDVELTELWLSKVVGYSSEPGGKELIRAIDHEMRERGAERVRTAWHAVADKREAAKVADGEPDWIVGKSIARCIRALKKTGQGA